MPTSTAATVTRASSPGVEPGDLDRQAQRRRAGASAPAASSVDLERARAAVDLEPGEPERAAGHALRLRVERPVRERDEIGAGAPFGLDRQRHASCRRRRRRRRVMSCTLSLTTARVALPAKRGDRRTLHRRRPAGSSPCRASCRGGRACRRSGRRDQPTVNDDARLRRSRRRRRARRGGRCPTRPGSRCGRASAAETSTRPSATRRVDVDGLEAPAAVAVEPLVAPLDRVERPGDALARAGACRRAPRARRRRSRSRPRRDRRRSSCARRSTGPSGRIGSVTLRSTARPPVLADAQRDLAPRCGRGAASFWTGTDIDARPLRVGRAVLLDLGGRRLDRLVLEADREALEALDAASSARPGRRPRPRRRARRPGAP